MAKKAKVGVKIPTLNDITKRYGQSLMMSAAESNDPGLKIPSQFLALNNLMGGGLPWGKVVEFMGMESSGKSLAAMHFAYATQQLGGQVIWVDSEQAWMNSWAEANGVDPSKVTLLNYTQIEDISDALADLAIYFRSQLTHNEPILVVVDSVAALDCADSINSKMMDSKADMGSRAKALYKMFRIRNEFFYKLGITQIYINQLRTKLNAGFGQDPHTTPGGAALQFYASIRLAFFGGKTLTIKSGSKEKKVGRYVTIRVMKNKVAPPKETLSKVPVYFNAKYHEVGFDRYFALNDALVELGVISKSGGGSYSYNGKTICRGEDAFIKALTDNSKLRRNLLKAAEINTISTTRKKLEETNINLYPVDEDSSNYTRQNEVDEEDYEDGYSE